MNEDVFRNDSCLDRGTTLVDAWHERHQSTGRPPDLKWLLAMCLSASNDELCDVLLLDQQLQWSAGPGPRVEEYLQHIPQLEQSPKCLVDLMYGEARAWAKLGLPVDCERFGARFPAIAGQLAKQFEVAEWLSDSFDAKGGSLRPPVDAARLDAETDFGEYELLEPIARGGMGIVYKARHRTLERIVALKMIPPARLITEEESQRFKNEVTAVSQLDHPCIISIFEVGEHNGVSYFTSRFVEPGSLAGQVAKFRGRPRAIAELMQCVASAIHHAHQRGVLHRDIKPSNVLIDSEARPYVTDFGLAKLLHLPSDLTHSGDVVGTPIWLAPEQADRKPARANVASDIYGLGAVLYFLLTGQPPFEGVGLIDTLAKIKDSEPLRPNLVDPTVNRDLEMICLKALDKDPSRRYSTAELMKEDLESFSRGDPVSARALPWFERGLRSARRHPVACAVSSVLLGAAILLMAMATYYTLHEFRLNERLRILVHDAARSKQATDQMRDEASEAQLAVRRRDEESVMLKAEAVRERNEHRLLFYAAHVKQAAEAILAGDPRRASDRLLQVVPNGGSTDLRGFEWFWLHRQLDVPVREVTAGMDNPRCLSYSPDGRQLAVGDSAGRVFLFDTATRQIIKTWQTSHEMIHSVSFAPTSHVLATAGRNGTVCLWDLATTMLEQRYVLPGGGSSRVAFVDDEHLCAVNGGAMIYVIKRAHQAIEEVPSELDEVYAVTSFPPSKTYAAIGELGVGIWDLSSPLRKSHIPTINTPTNQSIQFSPDGSLLAFRSGSTEVQCWSVASENMPRHVGSHQLLDEPLGLAFAAQENQLLVGDKVGAVCSWRLIELKSGSDHQTARAAQWQGHEASVNGIAFEPRGRSFVSVGKDDKLKFWGPFRADLVQTLSDRPFANGHLAGLSFVHRSLQVAAGSDHGIQLWDAATCTVRETIDAGGPRRDLVEVSPDGRYLAAGTKQAAFVELWELPARTRQPKWRLTSQQCDQLVFSPDNRLLAVVDNFQDQVVVLNSKTGETVKKIPARQCWSAAFSPDGLTLAATVMDDIQIWDCSSWRVVHELNGHRSTTTTIAYSPDGRSIATGSKDRSIRIWNAATGKETHRLLGHLNIVDEVLFSSDSRSLVSTSHDGTLKVWHVATGESVCDLLRLPKNSPFHVAFSQDGNFLAVRQDHGQILLLNVSR